MFLISLSKPAMFSSVSQTNLRPSHQQTETNMNYDQACEFTFEEIFDSYQPLIDDQPSYKDSTHSDFASHEQNRTVFQEKMIADDQVCRHIDFAAHISTNEHNSNGSTSKSRDEMKTQMQHTGLKLALRMKTKVEVVYDGYKWRKYGKKKVKSSPYPSGRWWVVVMGSGGGDRWRCWWVAMVVVVSGCGGGGWRYDEWRQPSEVALAYGRGMFCVVPLGKALFTMVSDSVNLAVSRTIELLEQPDQLSPQSLQANFNNQLHEVVFSIKNTQSNMFRLNGNSPFQAIHGSYSPATENPE
ncbi:probable WRKY transcription factor 51 [Tanacetum coccineum]